MIYENDQDQIITNKYERDQVLKYIENNHNPNLMSLIFVAVGIICFSCHSVVCRVLKVS